MREPIFVGGYVSAIAELYLKHAGIPTKEEVEEFVQSDGKSCQKSKRIEIDFRDFFPYVMPRLIRQRNSKVEIRNPFDTNTFLHSLSYITNLLDKLDFKIKTGKDGWKPDYKKEKITWQVTHSQRILKLYADKHMK
jgi:hypothetical protein